MDSSDSGGGVVVVRRKKPKRRINWVAIGAVAALAAVALGFAQLYNPHDSNASIESRGDRIEIANPQSGPLIQNAASLPVEARIPSADAGQSPRQQPSGSPASSASRSGSPPPRLEPTFQVGNVTSVNQTGGTTAGVVIGNINEGPRP